MKAAILSEGSVSSKWTYEAMKKYFGDVTWLRLKDIEVVMNGKTLEVLYQGKPLPSFDCIYAKGSYRYASVLHTLTTFLSDDTYLPIRAESFTVGHDKLLTHIQLQRHKIPMPKTYMASTTDALKAMLDKVHYPIVLKLPSGTQGKGVMFAESFSSASSMLDALVTLKQAFIIQEYIETGGSDVRAIVVGDKVVACMRRKASHGEKRANIHAGGKGEAYTPPFEVAKLAVTTAKALGADICAVDILESAKGALVLEVNLSPGLQGVTAATKIDVADHIAKFLYQQAKAFTSSRTSKGASAIMDDLGIETETGNVKKPKELITNLDFRGDRILLPLVVTGATAFNAKTDVIISAEKDTLTVRKFR